MAAPLKFAETLITGDLQYPYGINVADLDGDGDIDVTVADARKVNSVFWFENTGGEKFVRHLLHHQPAPAWKLERHVIADINRDGLPDVAIVENSTNDVRWLQNPGLKSIREPWKPHFITQSGRVPGAYDLDVGDIDNDGWPDVATSSWRMGNMFMWHKNPGDLEGKNKDYFSTASTANKWAEWPTFTIAADLAETRFVKLFDIDGDGDLDVVGTAARAGLVLWFENPNRPTTLPWTQHVIDKIGRPSHGQVIDMDGDGDPDLVMANGMASDQVPSEVLPIAPKVAWYENLGTGAAWKKHIIQDPFPAAFEAVVKDLDGDRDLDVVATAWHKADGLALAWFENLGGNRWTTHPIKQNWPRAVQVIVEDIDKDGRPDIIASAEDGSMEVRWWRNEGPAR